MQRLQYSLHGLAVALMLVLLAMVYPLTGQAVRPSTNALPRTDSVSSYTTTWASASGTHTVITPRLGGESAGEHAARHASDVRALQAVFPKI